MYCIPATRMQYMAFPPRVYLKTPNVTGSEKFLR